MNDILSPPVNDQHLLEQDDEDVGDDENLIKIKLFFYSDDKKLHGKVFPEEWYTVVADEYGEDAVSKDFQPWLEVSDPHSSLTLFLAVPHERFRHVLRNAARRLVRGQQTLRGNGVRLEVHPRCQPWRRCQRRLRRKQKEWQAQGR